MCKVAVGQNCIVRVCYPHSAIVLCVYSNRSSVFRSVESVRA